MREYLMLALSLAVISSLVGLACHSSLSPTARVAVAIVTLAAMLSPFLEALNSFGEGLPELAPSVPPPSGGYIEVSQEAFSDGIAQAIEERFSIKSGEVEVECIGFSFSTMRAQTVRLSLKGSALLVDYRELSSYVAQSFTDGGRCYIDGLETK